ncbi:MAG: glycosyltransferase family 2 protein [Gemmatimonadota bacterium]|nr:glycosyltransferase family 2 protein [Gemmatimonadota bacterium]
MATTVESGRTLAIVLNWCAEDDTAACVQSLLMERQTTTTLDILVVDNASPDGSGDRLAAQFPTLSYLQTGANLGYAGGNAQAMQLALARGYEFILIINDDATVRPGCVRLLLEVMASEPGVGACAPTIVHGQDQQDIIWWAGGRFQWWKALGTHDHYGTRLQQHAFPQLGPQPITFACGCVVLFRSSAIRACGSFRPEFFAYAEDVELSLRLVSAGWGIRWVPAAVAVHAVRYPAAPPTPWAMQLRDTNRRRLARAHYRGWKRALFALVFSGSRLVLAGRYLANGDRARARAVISALGEPAGERASTTG